MKQVLTKAQANIKTAFIYSKVNDLEDLSMNDFKKMAANVAAANKLLHGYLVEHQHFNLTSIIEVEMPLSNEELIKAFFEKHYPSYKNKGRQRMDNQLCGRHCFYYLMYKHTSITWKALGNILGQDHTTVIHAFKNVENMMETKQVEYVKIVENFYKTVKF